MNENSIIGLFEKSKAVALKSQIGDMDPKVFEQSLAVLRGQADGSCKVKVPYQEAINSSDAAILFPHVISDFLYKPKEPFMIGQTLLAKTIRVDSTRMYRFPSFGALKASLVNENQEYPDQTAAIAQHQFELRIGKAGLRCSLPDEVVEDSMWDLFKVYIEAMGFAMARLKEEQIFYAVQTYGHASYDNSIADATVNTTGKGSNGTTNNYTLSFNDLMFALGGLVSNGYTPTDVVAHPMAWAVFATDPVLRNVWVTGGQVGQSIWNQMPKFDQSMNIPWNISYNVSPFMPFTVAGTVQSVTGANVTDIYCLDRNQAVVVLQREDVQMDSWDDLARDARTVKLRERYGVAVPNGGRGATTIKNIRLATNYMPVTTVMTVAAA